MTSNIQSTKRQIVAAIQATAAVGDAIRELGSVPLGTLYGKVSPVMDKATFDGIIELLKNESLIAVDVHHVARWVGPAIDKPALASLALYNNDVSLFRNARESYRSRRIALQVVDGMIHADTDGWVARFESNAAAELCLLEAGYEKRGAHWVPRVVKTVKVYSGKRGGPAKVAEVWITDGLDNQLLDAGESLKHVTHSPTGFEWGYHGSGPAQLAFALLLNHTGETAVALRHYQEFKRNVVALFSDNWTLTAAEISVWLEGRAL